MILNIGVIDQPEPESDKTTFEVAEILEAKYELFSNFAQYGLPDIADLLGAEMEKEITNIANGKPPGELMLSGAMAEIEDRFKREYLSEQGSERIGIAGVPTKAALEGKTRRMKGRKNKRGRRPSFIDTGTLQTSMKAWMENGNG